jgi:Holliday junction resolvase RusA-like endonuclease
MRGVLALALKQPLAHVHARDVERFTLSLPFPPSTNNLFVNVPGRGRVTSPRYATWKTDAALRLLVQRPHRVSGPFEIEIAISRPDRRRRDLDGLAKPILDALVQNGVVDDDHLCQRLTMEWAPTGEGVLVVLTKAAQ